jgi:AAA+ ATPase superfamily predicted ATPase
MFAYFIQTPRQAGKTTFAINEIFNKRDEDFYFFGKSQYLIKSFHSQINSDKIKKMKSISTNCFIGMKLKYLICDDIDHFGKSIIINLLPSISSAKEVYFFFTNYTQEVELIFDELEKNENCACLKFSINNFDDFHNLSKRMLFVYRAKKYF